MSSAFPSRETIVRGASAGLMLLVVALVVPFVVYSIPGIVGAEASFVVLSGSMEPTLGTGDVILVYDTDPSAIEEGTVITYWTGEEIPTTHRVTEVINDAGGTVFQTKGDANEDPDPTPVRAEQVIGVVPSLTLPVLGAVYARIPALGHVLSLTSSTLGFIGLVVLPIVLLVLTEAYSLATGIASRANDNDRVAEEEVLPTTEPQPEDGATDRTTYTVTPRDLQFSALVLVAFTVYAVGVAAVNPAGWSIAVAVGTAGALAMVAAIIYFGTASGEPQLASAGPSVTDSSADVTYPVAGDGGELTEGKQPRVDDTPPTHDHEASDGQEGNDERR